MLPHPVSINEISNQLAGSDVTIEFMASAASR